jgi:ABC-type bacteriocin/lantibiotic exporter with double-glycine peptidase domain
MNEGNQAPGSGARLPRRPADIERAETAIRLPATLLRYVLNTSGYHQALLLVMTVAVFLIELVPLELQRRIINDLVKNRTYGYVITLCVIYAGVVLVHGSTKLGLNIYRNWVGERAVRDLRQRIRDLVGLPSAASEDPEAQGVEISMIVAEVEPIGAFVGSSVSEPLLQGGVMLSVLAYMIHLDVWMAFIAVAIFVPQLIFVPLMQKGIIARTAARVQVLRGLSVSIVDAPGPEGKERMDHGPIQRVFELDMGIFKLKFTMNFLMNFCNHLQRIAALLLGGWYVLNGELEVGGVVAFISGVDKLNDPWGDLVNYFRDFSVSQVKYRLVSTAVDDLIENRELAAAEQ